jgi:hypothetical protein
MRLHDLVATSQTVAEADTIEAVRAIFAGERKKSGASG